MAKMKRKELVNSPDEFMAKSGSVLKWIKENQKRFITLCVIIALIITSITGFVYWRGNRERSAMVAYQASQGSQEILQEISQKYGDTRAGKLSQLQLASLNFEQNNFVEAIDYADNFINSWGHKDLFYWQAILITTSASINQEKYNETLPLLDSCIQDAPESLKNQARYIKGLVLKDLGKYQDSRDILMKVSGQYMNLARVELSDLDLQPVEKIDGK
ncbi:MAG: tetratricopeptide repeat protein [Deltaproteobacteria bacterium]|nr:tetratricopeptide repeat protein [Deltaproteobacteria bacterium]